MSNKRCVLNGVFQSGVLRGWPGSARAEHTNMPENTGVFRHSFSLGKSSLLSQVKVRNLKNTVWKTPFGTLRETNPHLSQGQTGQNGNFTLEFNRRRQVCPKDGTRFVPGTRPVCPKNGSCLSRTPSRPKCLCLLVFLLPKKCDPSVPTGEFFGPFGPEVGNGAENEFPGPSGPRAKRVESGVEKETKNNFHFSTLFGLYF